MKIPGSNTTGEQFKRGEMTTGRNLLIAMGSMESNEEGEQGGEDRREKRREDAEKTTEEEDEAKDRAR